MIVITAPTGQIGRRLVDDLVAAGAPLRLVARDGSRLPDAVRGRVEVVEGSHGDPAVIGRALEGAEALFWLAPSVMTGTMEESFAGFARPAAEAVRRNGVKRIVGVTALGRGTPWADKAGLVTASLAMDDLLMSSGAAFRGLAMPSFMENLLRQAGPMKEKGTFFGPIDPDRKVPWTATRDMGAAAARLLADVSWTGQKEVPLPGPEELSFDDVAAVISEVAGRAVRYQQISFDAFRQQFLDRGASQSFAQGYVDMYRAKGEGMDSAGGRGAGGLAPTTLRQFCADTLKPALAG